MAKEICISSTPHETRLAILEDDQLAEIYYERENEYTLAGSIYNGRVTRVLPGMQSAFVDLGLERDAFLYVTDFMELEDNEDAEELEKAASSGAAQPPREVRHTGGAARTDAPAETRTASRTEGRPPQRDQRSGRPPREPRVVEESAAEPMTTAAPGSAVAGAQDQSEADRDGGSESGGRRWRGRRHRRGARGSAAAEGAPEPGQALEITAVPHEEVEIAPDIQASGFHPSDAPAPRSWPAPSLHPPRSAQPAPAAFVLPGESLSKYGAAPADESAKAALAPASPAPVSSASSFKPSTLIESPILWDGSGMLPGESISKHRGGQREPAAEAQPAPQAAAPSPAHIHEEELDEETEQFDLEQQQPDPDFEASHLEEVTRQAEPEEAFSAEPESGASASHHVNPLPPSGFRLFGFGKKKEESTAGAAVATTPVSSYAPGDGLVEEELIEGEEFDSVPHARHHKADEHELDDFEEETLPTRIRSGELGEMFQEAHLEHRIDLNLEGEDDDLDEGEEEAEPAVAGVAAQPQRDRGARGGARRARGAQPQTNRRGGPSRRSMQTSDLPIISDLLKPGQEILVQIAKEPIAKKGARITSHIALPGRFLVFMPTVTHVGVSRKIASDEERHRLKRILVNERGESSGGFIVRTAAEGASEEELRADLRFLMNLWAEIKQRSDASKSPALIYHDLSLIERILRDQVSSNFSNIWVDSEADYERIVRFLNRFSPTLVRRVKLYTKDTPLFEHFGIQDEISKALRSKVWLKSGGSIVINQTEALVAIDINTGKYVGKSARLEDTIVKTNLDAVPEIVRQIRLRDLGGIIVIDFIDMDERKNRYKVLAALEEALKADRAPTKVLQFNDFGLVAITRKRVKQSLERTLSVPCATCQATGMVKSPTTVCNEIYTELRKMKKHFEAADIMLRVHPETVKVLKANNAGWLTEFEELTGKNILVKSDPTLHPEQFDIQG